MIQRKRLTPNHIKKQLPSGHKVAFIPYLLIFILLVITVVLLNFLPFRSNVQNDNSFPTALTDSILTANRSLEKKVTTLTEKISQLENKLNTIALKSEINQKDTAISVKRNEKSNKVTLDISLQILNGCGKEGITEQVGAYLEKYGVTIASKGNYKHFKVKRTFFISQKNIPEDLKKTASILGISTKQIVRKKVRSSSSFILVLGKDYKSLTPFKK